MLLFLISFLLHQIIDAQTHSPISACILLRRDQKCVLFFFFFFFLTLITVHSITVAVLLHFFCKLPSFIPSFSHPAPKFCPQDTEGMQLPCSTATSTALTINLLWRLFFGDEARKDFSGPNQISWNVIYRSRLRREFAKKRKEQFASGDLATAQAHRQQVRGIRTYNLVSCF